MNCDARAQATLRRNVAPDPRLDPAAAAARLGALDFKPGGEALFLGRAHYGCAATVLPSASLGLNKQARAILGAARGPKVVCWAGRHGARLPAGACQYTRRREAALVAPRPAWAARTRAQLCQQLSA